MLAGGEEYFAPPEEFDVETLRRFAAFCTRLRGVEKTTKRNIEELSKEADAVGTTMGGKQMAAGAICRHIKTWQGKKQLAFWYLLDKLAKQHRETFAFLFSQHLRELAFDFIPWEGEFAAQYEKLVMSWESVFDSDLLLDIIRNAKKERIYAVEHPEQVAEQRKHEEKVWEREIVNHQLEKGLDNYQEPCLAYLQGNCSWGENCTQLHPPGQEGTLPIECRLGDWRCQCGTINRHFRRRCFACPREKPQYRKDTVVSAEEAAIKQKDPKEHKIFEAAFGYDPMDEAAAVSFWQNHPEGLGDTTKWLEARREGYTKAILPEIKKIDAQAVRKSMAEQRFRPPVPAFEQSSAASSQQQQQQQSTTVPGLPKLPDGLTAGEKVYFVASQIKERGVQDPSFVGHLMLMCQTVPEAIRAPSFCNAVSPDKSALLMGAFRLVFRGWNAAANRASHPGSLFFRDMQRFAAVLPLSAEERAELKTMCQAVASG